MCGENMFRIILLISVVGNVRNAPQQTTEKETSPEYIHPDGLLNFDPYLSDLKPVPEEDDYIPLLENEETIDGLPIFLMEPNNSFVLRNKPATLLCRAANALEVYFKCNDQRVKKTEQLEHVNPQNGIRVVEVELNVTRNDLDEYFGGKYTCECHAWNSKGRIRSQCIFIVFASPEQTTEKETRPEYIHPDGLINFDPYLSVLKPVPEEDDYIPLLENEETIDGLPIFLMEPNNSFVLRKKPATLLCRAANALEVFFKCNDQRVKKTEQLEHVNPQNGVRVVEAELNVTRNDLDEYFGGKYTCECHAWNSKGRIRSQCIFIVFAYIKKQFGKQPQSVTTEVQKQVIFHCKPPLAVPPATIKWLRNGLTLKTTEKTLVLPRVGIQDMANYTCIAENIAGRRESDVAVLTVYVNGGWSDWTPWMPCRCESQISGKRRTRTCTEPAPTNGGAPCRGQSAQSDDDCLRCLSGSWSAWSAWSSCGVQCVRVRRRQCIEICSGTTEQHAACVDGLCSTGIRFYNNNTMLFVGIGITMVMLAASAAILYVWCRYRSERPGYTAARTGTSKMSSRDKNAGPDLTRSCNEFWVRPGNQYEMPQLRDSYASPFGDCSCQESSCINNYEMKLYSPSGESASSCTNSRTITSRSSKSSSHIAEIVASSPTAHSKVDVAVTLPPGSSEKSYRDNICLTIVK